MILFDVFMTFIEDFVLSYYSLKISHTPHKFCHILFMTLICMLETFMLTFISVNNLLLQFMLIITLCFFVCILQKGFCAASLKDPACAFKAGAGV